MLKIDQLISEARVQKNDTLETLKLMKAEFLKFQIKADRKVESGKKLSEVPLTEDEQLKVIRSMVKSRKDSIDQYTKAGRNDLAEKEEKELVILQSFLPKEPGREEIMEVLKTEITGDMKMGPAMGIAKKKFPSVSGAALSSVVKELLG